MKNVRSAIVVVLIVLVFASCTLFLPQKRALAIGPFGGAITMMWPGCQFPPAIHLYLGPPTPGGYMYVWGTSFSYMFGPPSHIGQWLLGMSGPPIACLFDCGPDVCVYGYGSIILFHGSSGPTAGLAEGLVGTIGGIAGGIAGGIGGGLGGGSSGGGSSGGGTPVTLPTAPDTLSAGVQGTSVVLLWLDHSTDETGFVVERSTGSGAPLTTIATTSVNAAFYTDTNLSSGTYYYQVRAYNSAGYSGYSNTVTAVIP